MSLWLIGALACLPACLPLAVVSFFVLPVRASVLLEKKMARTLVRIGDLAVWLIGQACVPPAPGSSSAMPGMSGTDQQW